MHNNDLRKHVFSTYKTLRYGLALLTILLPIMLIAGALLYGFEPLSSISEYYHSGLYGAAFLSDLFVGLLFAIGIGLILYKGFSTKENIALNIAGFCAIGVALIPMKVECTSKCYGVHEVLAVGLFACIAYVSLFCTKETLNLLTNGEDRNKFKWIYKITGIVLILSPITALAWSLIVDNKSIYVFLFETVAIWTFAFYWWTKSKEMALSEAELSALQNPE